MKSEPFLLSVKHGLADCGPWAGPSLQPVVVKEALLEHGHTHCFTCCLILLLRYHRRVEYLPQRP